jgi:hypothetical protein
MSRRSGPWRLADGVGPLTMAPRTNTNTMSRGQTVTADRMPHCLVCGYLGAALVAAVIALVGLSHRLW